MKKLLNPEQVANVLGIPIQRFYYLAREELIPVVRIGKLIRVDEDELKKWIMEGGKRVGEFPKKK
ncbi:helix-turn-helix domain-containing protein [Salirhabdus sp. Marseille-P4669]|uniref:helix-turn-helix domain-containing protein n=1 Tax=Salirhabdus sp. Marseille-P4669 TaxID=2042310 RepID=UPI000C7C94D8|nr:helix-turn-helix domain-containing protein [Salirhabdus sp. Marseille-P4669]